MGLLLLLLTSNVCWTWVRARFAEIMRMSFGFDDGWLLAVMRRKFWMFKSFGSSSLSTSLLLLSSRQRHPCHSTAGVNFL
ncbi:hypothetical protein QBC32DRAFT_335965 [Pseudoneurospora amorphoporcata]|uniref:Secreted protein n=1 Tax=Pseudoneurospora amorphoporcata TaxID=241081 RepID=A0AAN6SHI3_9PEZI|nr:hypothetical protein QBC32DRAFT_335965 [Pseudoneurospora amorphoporcata]